MRQALFIFAFQLLGTGSLYLKGVYEIMKIKYKFATGEIFEIEVEDSLAEVVLQIKREEYCSNRRETRRHESYSDDNDKLETLVDKSINIEKMTEWSACKEELYSAIRKLSLEQQRIVQMIYFEGKSNISVSKELGITKQALNSRLNKIYSKLKNNFY